MIENPFRISRVDTPFQQHPDLKSLRENEFATLMNGLSAIAKDPNHQSRGLVITGGPGSGKTHLLMRLAQDVLETHRILFIRQPNNREHVLFHIYSRILESLVEPVPGTEFSQLSWLLGKSVAAILIRRIEGRERQTRKEAAILAILSENPLNLFLKTGAPGSEVRRRNWQFFETKTLEWWEATFGLGGHGPDILKALIRYLRYTDPVRRRLVYRWLSGHVMEETDAARIGLPPHRDEGEREAFSMEAVQVLARLSLSDAPLVIAFDQLEGLRYDPVLFSAFTESVKELFTHIPNTLFVFTLFPDRWADWVEQLDDSIIHRLGETRLHLGSISLEAKRQILELRAQSEGLSLTDLFEEAELAPLFAARSIRAMLVEAARLHRQKTEGMPAFSELETPEPAGETIAQLAAELATLKRHLKCLLPDLGMLEASGDIEALFDKRRPELENRHGTDWQPSESDDAGKLLTLARSLSAHGIPATGRLKAGGRKLPDHVLLKGEAATVVVAFLHQEGTALTSRLKNLVELATGNPDIRFHLFRDGSAGTVSGKVARQHLAAFRSRPNTRFVEMDAASRLRFDLMHELVLAVLNRDIDSPILQALEKARLLLGPHPLFSIMKEAGAPV